MQQSPSCVQATLRSLAQWLSSAVDRASRSFFGKPPMAFGEGGTIPFMGMLGEKFPEAQFLITGVRLTACVASVVADHFAR